MSYEANLRLRLVHSGNTGDSRWYVFVAGSACAGAVWRESRHETNKDGYGVIRIVWMTSRTGARECRTVVEAVGVLLAEAKSELMEQVDDEIKAGGS